MMNEVTKDIEIVFIDKIKRQLEDAKENAQELLQNHEASLGRTTRANNYLAKMYENEILELDVSIHKLNKKLGFYGASN